mmetsp:Transcript_166/g.205  ORF Transcript_166/g.205 Transcript_166/m.205 type:complete len:155 (+) Transcript_166:209-673(+)
MMLLLIVVLSVLLTSCGAMSAQEKIDSVKQKNREALLNSRRELANSNPRQNNQNQSPEALFNTNRRPSSSTISSPQNIPTSSFNQNSPFFHQNSPNSPTTQQRQQTSPNNQQRTLQSRQQNRFNTVSQFSATSQGESISAASQVEILNLRGSNR